MSGRVGCARIGRLAKVSEVIGAGRIAWAYRLLCGEEGERIAAGMRELSLKVKISSW